MASNSMGLTAKPHRLVFVYGTLRRGGSNDITRLHPSVEYVCAGSVAGRMYDLGAYPGVVLARAGDSAQREVLGEIYWISEDVEAALDVLEEVRTDNSGEYVKEVVEVKIAAVHMHCLLYEIHSSRIEGRRLIQSGDWLAPDPES